MTSLVSGIDCYRQSLAGVRGKGFISLFRIDDNVVARCRDDCLSGLSELSCRLPQSPEVSKSLDQELFLALTFLLPGLCVVV